MPTQRPSHCHWLSLPLAQPQARLCKYRVGERRERVSAREREGERDKEEGAGKPDSFLLHQPTRLLPSSPPLPLLVMTHGRDTLNHVQYVMRPAIRWTLLFLVFPVSLSYSPCSSKSVPDATNRPTTSWPMTFCSSMVASGSQRSCVYNVHVVCKKSPVQVQPAGLHMPNPHMPRCCVLFARHSQSPISCYYRVDSLSSGP